MDSVNETVSTEMRKKNRPLFFLDSVNETVSTETRKKNRPRFSRFLLERYCTPAWALLIAFFRYYPDILEDLTEAEDALYSNSLLGRVTKRYQARYQTTFTFACRGYGKTTCTVSSMCNKGILYPGEVAAYYAPVEKQAAPLASKAFGEYAANYPVLADHWRKTNDAKDFFRLATRNGSRFIMDIDRGMDTSCVVAEECGQEDKNPFHWDEFNTIVLGTNRKQILVNGVPERGHIDFQEHYITSCCRKDNPAYMLYRKTLEEMLAGESAFAVCIPWQAVVLCGMKPWGYYNKLKRKLSHDQFARECESRCTGSGENPLIPAEVLEQSRRMKTMEEEHCGNPEVFYVIGYDVSYRDVRGNALTAMAVIKCEPQEGENRDRYRKGLVYVCDMRPPATAREHARQIRQVWGRYRCAGAHEPYLVIDARSYGTSVVECLHELEGDGLPPLCTIDHQAPFGALERQRAVPVIYPMQATGGSGKDPNTEMLDYAAREFENGSLNLLTEDIDRGVEAFKLKHGITHANRDAAIELPYRKTTELVRQIGNLQRKAITGGWTEVEISRAIPKDMWSATLYACRMVQRLERDIQYLSGRQPSESEREAMELGIREEDCGEFGFLERYARGRSLRRGTRG